MTRVLVTRRCDHRLIDILVIAVCAVIACAESWEDIELYGRSKRAWLGTQGNRVKPVHSYPAYAEALRHAETGPPIPQ